ncbi:ribose-5-phosphate isomerase [Puerhibacterium puerhi]|uniref:ribose-5-phosphate isomerase n=1 Tax=Puerhibacterium puerhi TaxID=2692623 RepID=UPI00135C940C|nr:ribose-5-phosphate isomerase [Puerhibacterium puerhi]
MGWRIAVGADSAGYEYKEALKKQLQDDPRVDAVVDVGVGSDEDVDYPHIGVAAGRKVADGEVDRALLVCGTGIGVAMAANTVPGVRASVAHDSFSVERLVKSNNAQVLTFGQRVIGLELAKQLASQWLDHVFDETSASAAKVAALEEYDRAAGERQAPAC